MKQPTIGGLAATELLYGSGKELNTESKVFKPTQENKSLESKLRGFLSTDFEENRAMPNSAYEREKRILNRYPLTADEIQEERQKAVERCGV